MKDLQDKFAIKAQPQNAAVARERVRQAAAKAGFQPPALDDIEIAVGEAVTNAILYGCPSESSDVVVALWLSKADRAFHVEIRDHGKGFNPAAIRENDGSDALGGRGLRLMRALMDRILLHYDGSGMSVRLTKRLPHP